MNKECPPVLFIVFNRPELTRRVFQSLRASKPQKLFIAADGPRDSYQNDPFLCEQTREVVRLIDWDCELQCLFRDINLGCKIAVSSAISWFFEHVDAGIILEDDCLPDVSFYKYCYELLNRFSNDQRIMMISGDNFQKNPRNEYSYYFSKYPNIWGWATWKRAWKNYDVNISLWNDIEVQRVILDNFSSLPVKRFWFEIFNLIIKNQLDTWDYQWAFSCFINNGLSINPSENLVSNIGFSSNATHSNSHDGLSNFQCSEMNFPLHHPKVVLPDRVNDEFLENMVFYKPSRYKETVSKAKKLVKHLGQKFYEQL